MDEVKEKEQHTSQDSVQALQNALDGVNKRLQNLLAFKISPDNSDGSLLMDSEFAEKKQLLLQEKDKLSQRLNTLDPNHAEWAEIGKDSFNFALLASKKFKESNDPREKKLIARTVGSKQILLYHELLFQPRFLFLKYKEGIERTKEEIKRLVTKNSLINQAKPEFFCKKFYLVPLSHFILNRCWLILIH